MLNTELSTNSSPAILAIIDKVAADPQCNFDKVEQLLSFHCTMLEREASQSYAEAMALCQAEMPAIATDSENTQTRSQYASLDTIVINTKSIYTRNGFAISFGTGSADKDGDIRVTLEAMHNGGHSKHYHIDLPPDLAGIKGTVTKTNIHAAGSTFSYAKRYLFCMVFNIAVGEEDTDGVPAQSSCTVDQATQIDNLCEATGKTQEDCFALLNEKFKTHYDGMAHLTQSHAQYMIERLNYSLNKTKGSAASENN